jgi:hypothetical protein
MKRTISMASILVITALSVTAAPTAFSHHPSRVELCRLATLSGQLERIDWRNPHVVLSIRTDSGEIREVGWLNLHRLALAGIDKDTLALGDRLVIEGGILPQDIAEEPILVSHIRRPADGWEWEQVPEGC